VDIGVGRPDEALERLRGCLRFSPRTAGERELINRCRVLLGYLHYERSATADSALAKATLVLRKVPRRSIYFEDALLGLAWTSLKARQWEDCIVAAEALTKSPRTVLRAEGLLLIAYTHYARERYAEAVEVLEEAERSVEDAAEHGPVEDEASSTPFDPLDSLGMTVDRLVRKRRRPSVRREITQLAEEHREMHRALEKRLSLAVDAARDRSFVRRLPTLRDDIQYSLAAATYMLHAEGGAPQAGPGKKQKRLDKKIEALERKVRELESGP
jgi:tetratricopeptide (TPR) repeat protein